MAEFSETMRKWTRMCEYYGDGCGDSPSRCPLADMHGTCEAIYNLPSDGVEWESIERIINEWHEPVYPTWREFIYDYCVKLNPDLRGCNDYQFVAVFMGDPIPADIAEKLGIEPKEPT